MSDAARDREDDKASALALAPVLRDHIREFEIYDALLRKWQKSTNLVAAGTLPQLWTRHFADSAQILDAVPNLDTWADLGSGAGFPGMVLAICLKDRPGARVHLIESDQRKVSFLRAVSRETGAPAEIHLGRIESVLPSLDGRVGAISARALAPLSQLVDWSRELLLKSAVGVFLKGEDWTAELTDSKATDSFQVRTFASRTHSSGRIVAIARDFGA